MGSPNKEDPMWDNVTLIIMVVCVVCIMVCVVVDGIIKHYNNKPIMVDTHIDGMVRVYRMDGVWYGKYTYVSHGGYYRVVYVDNGAERVYMASNVEALTLYLRGLDPTPMSIEDLDY